MQSYVSQLYHQKLFISSNRNNIVTATSITSRNVHAVGYADCAENQNLIVANDPSFTSLSFEEISPFGKLTHLDLNCSPYEDCINCCSFNSSSSLVSVSVGKDSVFLWDVQNHMDVQQIKVMAPVRGLQRFMNANTWIGSMDKSLVVFDASLNQYMPFIQNQVISCFAVSPDKQMLVVGDFDHKLHIYDILRTSSPVRSIDLPTACTPVCLSWDDNCRHVCVNGVNCIATVDVVRAVCNEECIDELSVVNNLKYPRGCGLIGSSLIVGDDFGSIRVYSEGRIISVNLSKSPIMSINPLSTSIVPGIPDPVLITTDTEIAVLSLTYSSYVQGLTGEEEEEEEEEEADVINLEENNEEEAEAWMLQGIHSEYMRCSYEQSTICRQQVFVCRTCRDQYDRYLQILHPSWNQADINQILDIGTLCEQCAYHCHQSRGHDICELGVKNSIACDCGNDIYRRLDRLFVLDQSSIHVLQSDDDIPRLHECSLYPNKQQLNQNLYTHNWRERWCYCDKEEYLPMVQCIYCCDWFHSECASKRYEEIHGQTIDLDDETIDFYCQQCEKYQYEEKEIQSTENQNQNQNQSQLNRQSQLEAEIEEENHDEDKEGDQEEKLLERRIRNRLRKNDKLGAMKLIMKYILKQSLSESASNQRNIVIQNDVARASKMLEKIIQNIKNDK